MSTKKAASATPAASSSAPPPAQKNAMSVPPAASGSGSKSPRMKPPPPESLLLEEAMQVEQGEEIAVACVSHIVKAAMDKLTEHYLQQVAMKNTAKQAIDFVLQAIEWQLLVHDDGEKLTVRKLLAEKKTNNEPTSASDTEASSSSSDNAAETELPPAPSPITEPDNRARPALDIIASKLSLPNTYNQIWTCEEEPAPADLDRWARGVIPTKSVTAGHAPLTSLTMPGGMGATIGGGFTVVHEADEGSTTPRSGTNSLTPSQSRQGHFRSPTRGSSAGSISAGALNAITGSHRKARSIAEEKEAAVQKAPQPFALEVTLSKEAIAKEKAREADLRRLEKKKKAEGEIARARALEQAEKERMERIQTDLKHRPYTFDSRGNVILIAPVPAERFPAFQATAKVQVKDEYLTDEQEEEIRKREKRNRFKKASITAVTTNNTAVTGKTEEKTSSGPVPPLLSSPTLPSTISATSSKPKSSDIGLQKKKTKVAKPDTTGFLDLNATQPSLMATLTLSKGVTLKQGALSKTFDPRNAPSNTNAAVNDPVVTDNQVAELRGLTRKEYLKKLAAQQAANSSFLPGQTSTALGPTSPSPKVLSRPTSAPRGGGGSQAQGSPRDSTEDLSANGGEDVEWSSNGLNSPSREYDDQYDQADAAADQYRRPTTSEAFNHFITHDPSWGQNPPTQGASSMLVPRPPPPNRPTQTDRLLAVGARAKNPRDRTGVDTVTSQPTRKHLPPAPFGAVTGHGLQVATSETDQIPSPPISPSKSFAKIPVPTTITATDKAKLYFRQQ